MITLKISLLFYYTRCVPTYNLIPVKNEHMRLRTANTNDQSRLNIKWKGFLETGAFPEQQKQGNSCYIPETGKL